MALPYLRCLGTQVMAVTLILGDCLEEMNSIPKVSIDLIYIDPPFNTGRDFKDFDDRWKSQNIYLDFLRARIEVMYGLLKPTGSFYLHCDPTASHYIKVMLDDIFGLDNFRNEIVWCYSGPSNAKTKFPQKHDTIFLYSKSGKITFNIQRISYQGKLSVGGKSSWAGKSKDINTYLDKGKAIEDWWIGIPALQRNESEKVGYQTQKPLALLERIIKTSSNENDIIADFFCGSGTTGVACKNLNRNFIGIDISKKAIELAKKRISSKCCSRRPDRNVSSIVLI